MRSGPSECEKSHVSRRRGILGNFTTAVRSVRRKGAVDSTRRTAVSGRPRWEGVDGESEGAVDAARGQQQLSGPLTAVRAPSACHLSSSVTPCPLSRTLREYAWSGVFGRKLQRPVDGRLSPPGGRRRHRSGPAALDCASNCCQSTVGFPLVEPRRPLPALAHPPPTTCSQPSSGVGRNPPSTALASSRRRPTVIDSPSALRCPGK